jgi:type II secretory pathway component PulJ
MQGRHHVTAGFTLLEMLSAVFLATVVLVLVSSIFGENARQRSVASERLRVETTASTALDRIADDLEASILLKRPAERDPRTHAWRFIAEDPGDLGARTVRFQTQNVSRSNLAEHSTTWVEVVYFLADEEIDDPSADPHFTLWRWQSNRIPGDSDRRWPEPGEPGTARVAEGLADFGVRLIDAEGALLDEWDSTFAAEDAALPAGAEIALVLFRAARPGEGEPGQIEVPGRIHGRTVTLAMPTPIDVAALIELSEGTSDPECGTIADCADFDDEWFVELREKDCDGDVELCDLLNASGDTCWQELAREWPRVAASAAPECEELP